MQQVSDYAHNETVLQSALTALGHGVSTDRLRGELAWLAEQGLIVVHDVSDLHVATLTARGGDIALGRARRPGVARPRPGRRLTVGSQSIIDKLPEEAREALDEWLRDASITHTEAAKACQ